MFCENCGAKLAENSTFCEQCGARVTDVSDAAENNVAADTQAQGTEINNDAVSEDMIESTVEGAPGDLFVPELKVNTKRSKLKKILAAVVAIIAAGTVAVFASPAVRNTMAKIVMSPEQYFHYVMNNEAKDGAKEISSLLEEIKNMYTGESEYTGANGSLEVTTGEGYRDFIKNNNDYDIRNYPEYYTWFEKANITYDVASNKEKGFSADFGVGLNGTNLGNAEMAVDIEDGVAYFNIPGLLSEAIGVDLDIDDMLDSDMDDVETFLAAFPKEKVTNKLITKYAEYIVNAVEEVEQKTKKIEVDDFSQKLTVLTATIDDEMARNAVEVAFAEAKDDKDIEKLIKDVVESGVFGNEDADDIYDEFVEGIEDALDDIDDLEFDEEFDVDFYVNGKGELVGIGTEVDDFEFIAVSTEKGKKTATLIEASVPSSYLTVDVVLSGTGTKSGSSESGELTLEVMGQEIAVITYTDIDIKKLEDGEFIGTVAVVPGSDAVSLIKKSIGVDTISELLDGTKIELSAAENDMSISLYTDDKLFASVNINYTLNNNTDVKIPSSSVDEYEFSPEDDLNESWMNDLFSKLRKAGVPDSIVDDIEWEYEYSINPPDYSSYYSDYNYDDYDFYY